MTKILNNTFLAIPNYNFGRRGGVSHNSIEWIDIITAVITLSIIVGFIVVIPYLKAKRSKLSFVDELLLLIAHVIKVDNKVGSREKLFVENLLNKEFGARKAKEYIEKLNSLLGRKYSIKKVIKIIDYKESKPIKIQLLNNLIKITVVDGYLSKSEFNVLSEICVGLGLRPVRLTSMLAMYNYITEEAHKQSYNKTHRRVRTDSKLKIAFKVLGINENSPDKLIKKTYRKLVVLYHPDKTQHLSSEFIDQAKNKYLKINDAYDLIKAARGFK